MKILHFILALLVLYLALYAVDMAFTAGKFILNILQYIGASSTIVPLPHDIAISVLATALTTTSVLLIIHVAKSIRKRGEE